MVPGSFILNRDIIMRFFFSCDWGTSTFRLRLVETCGLKVLAETNTSHGIAAAFECWKQAKAQEENRLEFYQAYLFKQVKEISVSFKDILDDEVPVILSGMASSSIGMVELPYSSPPLLWHGCPQLHHHLLSVLYGGYLTVQKHKILVHYHRL